MESIMGPHRNREGLGNGEIRFNMAQRRHQHNMDSKPWLKMYEQDFQNELSLVMVWIWKVSYMCKWFKHLIPVSDNIWAVVETNMWDLSIRSRPLVAGLKVIASTCFPPQTCILDPLGYSELWHNLLLPRNNCQLPFIFHNETKQQHNVFLVSCHVFIESDDKKQKTESMMGVPIGLISILHSF